MPPMLVKSEKPVRRMAFKLREIGTVVGTQARVSLAGRASLHLSQPLPSYYTPVRPFIHPSNASIIPPLLLPLFGSDHPRDGTN